MKQERPYYWTIPMPERQEQILELTDLAERSMIELAIESSLLVRGHDPSIQTAQEKINQIRQYLDQIQAELPKYNPIKTQTKPQIHTTLQERLYHLFTHNPF